MIRRRHPAGTSPGRPDRWHPRGIGRLPVLMYHAVAPIRGPMRDFGVPPARLAEHLAVLGDAGYRLAGLTEAIALAERGIPVVALTFDDAYANVTGALPILAGFQAGATLYVPVAHVGRRADWLGEHAAEFGPILDWPALRDIAATGIEIGNHGLVHEPLDVLAPRDASAQIRGARDRIGDEIGDRPRSFAYPHGYHGATVRSAVAAAGHDNACEVGRRVGGRRDDRFAVPRLQPTPGMDADRLLRLVRGGPALMPRIRSLAQPGWRLTRRFARTAGVRLT